MRFDHEFVVAQAMCDYLTGLLDKPMLARCQVVTFFDPMSIEEASRIIVQVPSGEFLAECPGNSDVQLEIGIKSRWLQKTMAADFQTHYDRINAVRDKLLSPTLAADLAAKAASGVSIDHVVPKISFHSNVFKDGWIFSETQLVINCHTSADQPQS